MARKYQNAIFNEEVYAPFLELLEGEILTPKELTARWRYGPSQLANLRRVEKGVPWFHLPTGGIRYRLKDVLEAELRGTAGPLTTEHIILAVMSCQEISFDDRVKVVEHLRQVLGLVG